MKFLKNYVNINLLFKSLGMYAKLNRDSDTFPDNSFQPFRLFIKLKNSLLYQFICFISKY